MNDSTIATDDARRVAQHESTVAYARRYAAINGALVVAVAMAA